MTSSAAAPASADRTARSAAPVPHVPGRVTWFRSRRGTVYLRVDVTCNFCGARHAHTALGPRVSGCDRGLYVIDAPMAELSGGAV